MEESKMVNFQDLLILMGKIDGKMDGVLTEMRAVREHNKELEQRVQKLEKFNNWSLGAAAAIGVVAHYIIDSFIGE